MAFDLDQFGSPTVLIEPGIDPSQGYSDIVGIVKVADVFFLAFVSDTETTLVNFGTDTAIHYVVETGLPIDVTFYLSADLRSEGYTATFQSDLETPLPAALPLFATGLGALGLLGWRRKRKAAALAA